MPLFSFICKKCLNEIEYLEKYSSDTLHYCPKCRDKMIKQISKPSVIKIEGFSYQNGYSKQ